VPKGLSQRGLSQRACPKGLVPKGLSQRGLSQRACPKGACPKGLVTVFIFIYFYLQTLAIKYYIAIIAKYIAITLFYLVELWHFRNCNYCNIFLKGFVYLSLFSQSYK
jgi:hypothetical protein